MLFQRRRRRALEAAEASVEGELAKVDARLEALAETVDPADPTRGSGAARLDARSAAELLDGLSSRARFLATSYLVDDFTVAPRDLSLLAVAWQEAVTANQSEAGIEAYRVRGGNDQVPKRLAGSLGAAVRLSSPVTAIAADGFGVRVQIAGGAEVAAQRCVVALPPPALARVRFEPALPPQAGDVQLGKGSKTILQYRERVWREDGESGDALTDLASGSFWEATDQQRGRAGILIAYTAGTTRIPPAKRDAVRVWPALQGELRTSAVAAWAADPRTGGTYTAFAKGQLTRSWPALRGPFGRIHVAGEHTDPLWGYMQGAVRSGLRAADEILSA